MSVKHKLTFTNLSNVHSGTNKRLNEGSEQNEPHQELINNAEEDLNVQDEIISLNEFEGDLRAEFEEECGDEDDDYVNEDNMENSCFTLEIAGDEDEDADELRDTDRQGSENESDGALDGGNDAEQEEVERNLNLSQERNEENNGANDENGFNLNHSNLDSEVNAREGTKVKDLFVLALALSVRHNWNYEELIHHLQSPNSILEIPCLPQSKRKLFQSLQQYASGLTYFAYCPK
ncbi:Retrotransposon-derived protein PEG10 [Frankliniella fusca]|uniref:Retrotransposon-derived protein PEG10 n=1 Tax=Frankliniella fusca TaxID=407009 RepID=A0AAE1LFR7_9NEOP|nr:Retrotransposon-derived protein PEG10 [Frankliniella fusca]